MKKEYEAPVVEIEEYEISNIISTSGGVDTGEDF
ncbi:hypothetical protein JOC70_002800 [Clostridium pascui]|nr:hypothetical protein [Clostridium pascui]